MREDFLVMLDWQPHVIRAGVGMGEVIPRPRVEIAARAAYRKSQGTASGSVRRATDYLVGPALDEAERSGEELEIVWPLQLDPSSSTTSSLTKDGEREQEQGTSSSSNSNEKENGNDADQGSMKVDEADEGSAGKESSHNVSDGVQDWEALEALFRYILFTGLQMPSKPVNFMILLAIPSYLPPTAHERLTQMFFESYNIANFLIVERALVQLYSCAAMTGITVDVGLHATEVAVIHDAQIHPPSLLRCSIGEAECDQYLVDILLEANPDLPTQLSSPSGEEGTGAAQQPLQGEALYNAVLRLVNIMKDGEYIRFQVDKSSQVAQVISSRDNGQAIDGDGLGNDPEEEEEGITDVAKALASGKVGQLLSSGQAANVTVVDGDKLEIQNPHSASLPPILVGLERNRYVEPLFNPSLLSKCTRLGPNSASLKATSSSLPETIANAVQTLPEVEKRGMVWENIVFTGSAARVKGAASALIASLQRYAADVPAPPETASVQYSRRAKHARTPDYFSEFRERPDMTSFLGASIYAKLGFLESQGGEWLTKQDYNEYGPSIATRMNVNGN